MNNPDTCRNSLFACGIPICRIECIPCERVKECPLEKKVDMSMLSVEADNGDETR